MALVLERASEFRDNGTAPAETADPDHLRDISSSMEKQGVWAFLAFNKLDKRVAGFALGYPATEAHHLPDNPDYWCQGIGGLLVARAKQHAAEIGKNH